MSTTLMDAANQYASRPADERFPSLDALVSHTRHEKNLSKERTYNIRDLQAVADGAHGVILANAQGQRAQFTHWSFGQMARTVGAPAGYLRTLPPQLAADCLNHGIQDTPGAQDVNLLVRAANGTPFPVVRACTSETYGRVWDADLYGAVQESICRTGTWDLPPTWEGPKAGAYRGDRDSFLLLTNGGSIVTDPSLRSGLTPTGPGSDGMYRALLFRNSEVGASGVWIDRVFYRYICGNHIIWGAVMGKQYRRRHVGTKVLRDTIREISQIAYEWGNRTASADEAIIRLLIDREIAATKDAVVAELRALGATLEQATAAYNTCEQTERASPRSFWGIAQGVTRNAQATTYQDERNELDVLAGLILARGAKVAA